MPDAGLAEPRSCSCSSGILMGARFLWEEPLPSREGWITEGGASVRCGHSQDLLRLDSVGY